MDCKTLSARREKCHHLYGKLGEDCLIEELEEKRCLAFKYCQREAIEYYGTPNGRKALCASWAESFCFGSELVEENLREHHLRSQSAVNTHSNLKAQCRAVTVELSKCMSKKFQ